MSMQDPIADMFVRIRNAQAVAKKEVMMPRSKQKVAIAALLKEEGYINDFHEQVGANSHAELAIILKYHENCPVIEQLDRVSKPSCRVYAASSELPQVNNGLGVAIISTSKGMMSDRQARQGKLGGEVIGFVS